MTRLYRAFPDVGGYSAQCVDGGDRNDRGFADVGGEPGSVCEG